MHDQTGHRSRMRDRFRKEGLDSFEDVHVLELLLQYSIPRIDTKPLARELLNRFGSFCAVLEASEESLTQVHGIGVQTATFLRLVNAVGRHYQISLQKSPTVLNSIQDCGDYLSKFFLGRRVETVYMLAMDGKRRLICCQKLGEGELNSTLIPVRKLVEMILSANAAAVVLAHSHPGGLAVPSLEDIQITRNMGKVLASLNVALVDHLIFTEDDWISMVQSGAYFPNSV